MSDLKGKTALVTGGNSGIGRAAGAALARNGAHVVLSGRDAVRGQQAVAAIREAGGTADFVKADLGDEASARSLAREAEKLGGGHVDILVNSAGVFPFGPTHEATGADFDWVYDVNVKVPFFLVAELAPKMAGRGYGSIVNVTTMVAEFGAPQMALYGSSKAALVLLTKFLGGGVRAVGCPGECGQPRTDPHRGHRGHGGGTGPVGIGRPGRAAGAAGGDRIGDRVPGRGRGELRPWRAAAGRRRPSRCLSRRSRRAR